MKNKIYGYCRISNKDQNIDRQIRNIEGEYPDAIILQEAYTGTKVQGRKEFNKLLKRVEQGDTIIFDSVSRMSRNADEGIEIYMELFNKGIELIFLKEAHINTSTYRNQIEGAKLPNTDNAIVNAVLEGVEKALKELAKEQIKLAFIQSEKEVMDLRQRTKEGLETARLNGKQIGQVKGTKLTTKKSVEAKKQIQKLSKDFLGSNKDSEVMAITGLSRNTYYKYKREIIAELEGAEQ